VSKPYTSIEGGTVNKPNINVTPLIDVLLVLLIIFMVVTPLRPSSFKARIPREPDRLIDAPPAPDTLVAVIASDGSLRLNGERDLGTPKDLREVFDQRVENGNVSASFANDRERPQGDRIERTVFIKAPRSMDYGSVARIVDAVKTSGAYPISLQIDDLDGAD